jgi:D-amino peptidase
MESRMKLLIACDMEGISGVTLWEHVTPTHAEYQRFRRIMTEDVNAAVDGAARGGASEIVISDGHWNSGNILVEELDHRARIYSGTPTPFSMVQGADSGIDAAIFVGYHARAGSRNAVLDHTWSSTRVANLWINERLFGEFGLNAAVCGHFGSPALMVSGDQTVCAEARTFVPEVRTAQVKIATGRYAANLLPVELAQACIRSTAQEAVANFLAGKGPAPLTVETPVRVRLEFFNSNMADAAQIFPGANRLDGRQIEVEAADMVAAYRTFRTLVNLAG